MAEDNASGPGSERGAVVGAEGEHRREDALLGDRVLDHRDRLLGATAQADLPARDLPGAAVDDRVQVDPAVLGDPDRGHIHVPQLRGPGDAKDAGTPAARRSGPTLGQLLLAHHPQHALAVHGLPELAPGERPDHAVAVGRVVLRDLNDRDVDRITDRAALRRPAAWGRPDHDRRGLPRALTAADAAGLSYRAAGRGYAGDGRGGRSFSRPLARGRAY